METEKVVASGEFMNPEEFELQAGTSFFFQDLLALPEMSGLIAARRLLSFERGSVKVTQDGKSWVLCHFADDSPPTIARVIDIVELYVPGQLLVRMECDNCRLCPVIQVSAGASFTVQKGDIPSNELFAVVSTETTSFTRLHQMRESNDQLVFQCVW
jgi:hypothetical protein